MLLKFLSFLLYCSQAEDPTLAAALNDDASSTPDPPPTASKRGPKGPLVSSSSATATSAKEPAPPSSTKIRNTSRAAGTPSGTPGRSILGPSVGGAASAGSSPEKASGAGGGGKKGSGYAPTHTRMNTVDLGRVGDFSESGSSGMGGLRDRGDSLGMRPTTATTANQRTASGIPGIGTGVLERVASNSVAELLEMTTDSGGRHAAGAQAQNGQGGGMGAGGEGPTPPASMRRLYSRGRTASLGDSEASAVMQGVHQMPAPALPIHLGGGGAQHQTHYPSKLLPQVSQSQAQMHQMQGLHSQPSQPQSQLLSQQSQGPGTLQPPWGGSGGANILTMDSPKGSSGAPSLRPTQGSGSEFGLGMLDLDSDSSAATGGSSALGPSGGRQRSAIHDRNARSYFAKAEETYDLQVCQRCATLVAGKRKVLGLDFLLHGRCAIRCWLLSRLQVAVVVLVPLAMRSATKRLLFCALVPGGLVFPFSFSSGTKKVLWLAFAVVPSSGVSPAGGSGAAAAGGL